MKLDLLTNATVVEDAIRFVNTCASKEDENDKESKEQPDYVGNNVKSIVLMTKWKKRMIVEW